MFTTGGFCSCPPWEAALAFLGGAEKLVAFSLKARQRCTVPLLDLRITHPFPWLSEQQRAVTETWVQTIIRSASAMSDLRGKADKAGRGLPS